MGNTQSLLDVSSPECTVSTIGETLWVFQTHLSKIRYKVGSTLKLTKEGIKIG